MKARYRPITTTRHHTSGSEVQSLPGSGAMPRFISLILLSAFSLLFSLGIQNHSFAQGWYNSGWSYRKAITVNSGQVPSAQSNFPVLVSLTSDAGLSAHALANGNDILFTTSDGVTKIPYQRENYGGGTLVAWVNCPSVTNGTVLYMYYGNPGAADQQQATSAWDINYVGVYHVDEATTGIGDYKDATTTANNGMVQDAGTAAFLKTVFTVASADPSAAYVYEELTNPPNYTIASGDYLVYDVYWTSATTFIAVDLITTTAGALRDYGVVDQNGYGQHPAADLSPVALNKWYHRVIPLNVIATKIVDFYDIACTFKGTNKTGYVDNIFIMNGSTLKLAIRSPGGSTAHITNFQNPASGNTVTFSNVADPGSWSVTGKMVNCLAADGYRYINMGTRATTAVDNWTLEAWVNLDALSQHGYFVYNGNDGGGYGIGIGDGAGGAGTKLIGLAGSVAYIPSAYSFSTTGTWTHVVMKRTSGTATFLANGTSYAATAAGTSTPGAVAAKLTIGNELNASNSPTRYFSGLIDEVHISNVARTDNWIKTEYNNQNSPGSFYTVSTEQAVTTTTADNKTVCSGSVSLSLTATVSPDPGGGTVEFFVDNISVGTTGVISGIATKAYNPGSLSVGGHAIKANFSGNGIYLASSSDPGSNGILTVNPLPTFTVSKTDLTCFNAGNGQITINASGGTVPYTYSINGGSTFPYSSSPIINLVSGAYTIVVKDNKGCIQTNCTIIP